MDDFSKLLAELTKNSPVPKDTTTGKPMEMDEHGRSQRELDPSAESHIADGLRTMQKATDELSAFLDEQHNRVYASYDGVRSTKVILHCMLGARPYTICKPWLPAIFRNNQRKETVGFRKIGFGQCGLVFERPGRDYVVKIARPGFHDALWSDLTAHYSVYKAFQHHPTLECRVPTVYAYHNKDDTEWWDKHLPLFPDSQADFPMPSDALFSERILPLPKIAREALVALYCPPELQRSVLDNDSNRDCLARIYLGKRRAQNTPLAPNFTLRNFNLCLDQMLDLDLPVHDYASAMGEALAVTHWHANVDAYDVEFVLGSESRMPATNVVTTWEPTPEIVSALPPRTTLRSFKTPIFRKRTARLWILDFNLCNRWEEKTGWEHSDALIAQLVLAFFENDPYYPLPMMEEDVERTLWRTFAQSYLDKSRTILESGGKDERLHNLPVMFINGCIDRETQNIGKGLGHGHRDLKG
jgi:hypothetical protein